MNRNRKILLIENQKFQFDKIVDFDCLNCFDLFPLNESYIVFIDNVRVWVNKEYMYEYRRKALEYIKDYIVKCNIELIIMDYVLGGAYHCLTGIDLADEINSEDSILPVLFLSKTEQNEKRRMLKYDHYEKKFPENIYTKWIHKGYFGDEILNEDYFEKLVIPEINKLLSTSEEDRFWIKFDHVLRLDYPPNHNEKKTELIRIRENLDYYSVPRNLKETIEIVYSSNNLNHFNLDILKNAK